MAQNEMKQILQLGSDFGSKRKLNYLDLGCGNASVLQMVLWSLLPSFDITAFGIEARLEAVELARRSLSFNIGSSSSSNLMEQGFSCLATVIHQDFRRLLLQNRTDDEHIQRIQSMKFDLITGTPPYFRVDFASSNILAGHSATPQAIINQGGMPTSAQSAPARCEFRGGIEAYCEVAYSLLSDDGIFVVCENWLNIDRVHTCAARIGFDIQRVLPVKGKEGRKENLFGVFVMSKAPHLQRTSSSSSDPVWKQLEPIAVRTKEGLWTKSYCRILEDMSIPCV